MKKSLPEHFLKGFLWSIAALHCMQSVAASNSPSGFDDHRNALANVAIKRLTAITGIIKNNHGDPLFGVKVSVKFTTTQAFSDKSGRFLIQANAGQVLVFSLGGYLVKEVEVTGEPVNVALEAVAQKSAETPILYGSQNRKTGLQSAATVYGSDLQKVPVADITSSLTGRLTGLYTLQSGGGRPGADASSITLRGNSPLVLINGVPRNYSSIDPEQIESITVLKDGLSTVLYGQQSANGVLLIKTRSGETGRQRISFTAQAGLQSSIKKPQPLGAYDYAVLYNEALANDGKAARYTQDDLDAWSKKSDPLFHPDVDWYNTILKPNTLFSRYNMNIYGGGNSARYFVDLDYLNQNGILRQDPTNTYSTNTDYKRYMVRANIDIDVNASTQLNLNLFGRIQNGFQPGGAGANNGAFTTGTNLSSFGSNNIFASLAGTPNSAYPVFNPNGTLGGTSDYQTNLWGATTQSGYFYNSSRDVSADISLKKTLDKITKGLWIRALASFNTSVSENIIRTKRYAAYKLLRVTPDTAYQQFGTVDQQVNLSTNAGQSRSLYVDFSTGLDKQYGKHGINSLVTVNSQSARSGSNIAAIYTNIAGRIQYNYDERYMGEAALSYSGLNRYEEGNRFGFFYALGAGWNLSKEKFLKNLQWLTQLKLRANYAYTGNANPGYFAYNQYYGNGSSYNYGATPTSVSGVAEGTLANHTLTWEKAHQVNAGIDALLWKDKLAVTIDYFNNKNFDLMQQRGRSIGLLGTGFPNENIGVNRYSGWEFELRYNNHAGNFHYYVAPMLYSLQKIILFQDEVDRPYPWMIRTGHREDQTYGYVADGLFQSTAQINSSATTQGYNPVPGDIKYKDLNNDGVINELDMRPLKNDRPIWTWGLNFGFNYKGFDVSVLLQGVQNRYVYLSGSTEWAFQNNGLGQAFQQHLQRWTPATAAAATYPRLTIGSNPNNEATSSYWLKDGSYVRLKNVEIGYSLPSSLVKKMHLDNVRLFFNGINLYTIAAYDRIDPESYGNGYPLQKVVNAGINIKF